MKLPKTGSHHVLAPNRINRLVEDRITIYNRKLGRRLGRKLCTFSENNEVS